MVVNTRIFKTMVSEEFYQLIAAAEVGYYRVYNFSSERSIHTLNELISQTITQNELKYLVLHFKLTGK